MEIIGRTHETKMLKEYAMSKKSEFLVVYGRRRVGKTFLIKEFFGEEFCFYCTGQVNEDEDEKPKAALMRQLKSFNAALNKYGKETFEFKDNWFDSFLQLERLIVSDDSPGKKVIFIDEMPWLDTPKSGFLSAFEYFWNSFASSRPDILLIACGSATSWIVKKLFENIGGLFNRVTKRIHLRSFTLRETEEFFKAKGVVLGRYQIVESYMVFGGIPFYLDLFERQYGLAQNIDLLCFGEDALLRNEYRSLFATLFKNSEHHHKVTGVLARKASGLTRDEISDISGIANGGRLSDVLEELEQCGFLRKYQAFGKKSKGALFQLADPFILFHHKFLESGKVNDPNFWANGVIGGGHSAWSGYAFEQVCLAHIDQIRKALGITGVIANTAAWRSAATGKEKAQIDLVIDRVDHVINLCEMKYSVREFEITKSCIEDLEKKKRAFSEETKTNKALHTTLVTTYGVKRNKHYHIVQSEVTMQDLFA